jgi:predicted pyridoxine 5'-phosphate oxidase superfamily flavin-nucleotide-binding protein
MSAALPSPTGTAREDLLQLELSDEDTAAGHAGGRGTDATVPADSVTERVDPATSAEPADPLPEQDGPAGSHGEHLLQCAYGSTERASRFYRDQMLDHLNPAMTAFVQRMEMAFVATSDAAGEADCSLRAGPAGFIQVLDANNIAYPEYRGNGVLASLGNISENPHIGVLMVDFVTDLIGLHVNGRASIIEDVDLRAEHPELPSGFERGRMPERWVVVAVQEAYIHCRKHIPRMRPVDRTRSWGTDDMKRKGGDYFEVRASRQQGVR